MNPIVTTRSISTSATNLDQSPPISTLLVRASR